MTPVRRVGIALVVVLALAALAAAPVLGATHVWIGPANGAWSNGANWSGGVPTSAEPGGTIVQFGASTTSTMDISGLIVDQIHFTGASNTIDGSKTLTIDGSNLQQNVVSAGAGNTLSSTLPLTLSGAPTEAISSTGTLTIAGAIAGASGLVFLGSGGSFALTGTNTYTGSTTIGEGVLQIDTTVGKVIVGSSIAVGTGGEQSAQLVLENSNDISSETAITVGSNGVFNMEGEEDSAKSLAVNGGSVLGANLNVTGALVVNGGTITISGKLAAGSLSMVGGTINGAGQLALSGDIQATSAPAGPATIASPVRLSASPTVTVTPGSSPELSITGAISETGASRSLTKVGTGTMVMSASKTYTGTTTVSAGTLLVANGSQTGAFSVAQNATLGGSGTLGATTVTPSWC